MRVILAFSLLVVLFGFVPAQSGYKVATAGVGVDGIRVGKSTRSDVIKKFGKNFSVIKNGAYSYQLKYKNGISFYYCQKDKVQQIFDIEMRAPYLVRTKKGIVLSKSTVADVRKAYGKPRYGLRFRGIEFYYTTYKGKQVISVIDIVEGSGLRQCK
ncbi:MAG: hypothetical protein ACK5NT_12345 [Pyrinomonadaceae bacterium]